MINEVVDSHKKEQEKLQMQQIKEFKKQMSLQKKEEKQNRDKNMGMINMSIGEKLREQMKNRTRTESSLEEILSDPNTSDNDDLTFQHTAIKDNNLKQVGKHIRIQDMDHRDDNTDGTLSQVLLSHQSKRASNFDVNEGYSDQFNTPHGPPSRNNHILLQLKKAQMQKLEQQLVRKSRPRITKSQLEEMRRSPEQKKN